MKNSFLVSLLIILFVVVTANAQTVPFANQITKVRNYNRTTDQIATGGYLFEGGEEELKDNGFVTILDLRTPQEGTADEKIRVEKIGMKYVNIPIYGGSISDKQIKQFTEIIDKSEKPLLVHCGSGNRVGALLSLYNIKKGVPNNIAYKIGRASGMSLSMEDNIKNIVGKTKKLK